MHAEFRDLVLRRLQDAAEANPLVCVKESWITAAELGLFAKRDIREGRFQIPFNTVNVLTVAL